MSIDVPVEPLDAVGPYEESLRRPPSELAAYLQDVLGQKLTALATGTKDPKTVGAWARGQSPQGKPLEKLRLAYRITRLLEQREAHRTVRAWFVGMNPRLGERAPALVLAEGRLDDTLAAAYTFLGA